MDGRSNSVALAVHTDLSEGLGVLCCTVGPVLALGQLPCYSRERGREREGERERGGEGGREGEEERERQRERQSERETEREREKDR